MKKLIATVLFFASFGVAMGATQSSLLRDRWNGILNSSNNSCGFTQKTGWFSKNPPDVHCESPWHKSSPPFFPDNKNKVADEYRDFVRTHSDIRLLGGDSCNDFGNSASCNNALISGKKKMRLGASIWDLSRSLLGTNRSRSANQQNVRQGSSQGDGYETTQGCEWYEKKEYKTIYEPKQCPINPNVCSEGNGSRARCNALAEKYNCEWIAYKDDGSVERKYVERGWCVQKKSKTCCIPTGAIPSWCSRNVCKCLSSSSKIATPTGDISVMNLKVGAIVWTVDTAGNRIVRPLVRVSRVAAPNHRVVHLVLTDGRALDVSAPHPTADGRTVGDLKVGDAYDGSTVKSAEIKPYKGTATYDILPSGDTGFYFANGILMGSTLK